MLGEGGYKPEHKIDRKPDSQEVWARLSEGGALDVRQASEQDMAALFDLFENSFDQFDESQQLQIVEGLLAKNMVGDEELLDKVRAMNLEQKADLGVYLGRLIEPGTAVRTFHECWYDIPIAVRKDFLQEFRENDSEHALMVVPFTNLHQHHVSVEVNGKEESHSLREAHFNSYDRIEELIDVMTEYSRQHPEAHDAKELMIATLETMPTVVLQYLDKLQEADLVTDKMLEKMLGQTSSHGLVYSRGEFFLTDEDQAEEKDVMDELVRREGVKKDDVRWVHQSAVASRSLARRLAKLKDIANERRAEAILKNYKLYENYLNDKDDLFIEMVESGVPVMNHIDELCADKQQAAELMKKLYRNSGCYLNSNRFTDLQRIAEFNRQRKGAPDLEKLVLDHHIRHIIEEGQSSYLARELILEIDSVLPVLSPDKQQWLVRQITKHQPALWMYNIEYALQHDIVPADRLVEEMQKDASYFLEHYPRLTKQLRQKEKSGETFDISSDTLQVTARRTIEASPHLFGSLAFKKVYSKQEREDFFERQLTIPVDLNFIEYFIGSEAAKPYQEQIKRVLLEQPGAFEAATDLAYKLRAVIELIGARETIGLMLERIRSVDIEDFLDSESIMREMIALPGLRRQFMERLAETGQTRYYGKLLRQLHGVESDFKNHLEWWQEGLKRQEQNVRYLRDRLKSKLVSMSEKKTLRDDLRAALQKIDDIKKERLEESLSEQHERKRLRWIDEVRDSITEESQANKFYVFEAGVAGMDDLEMQDLMRENIAEYAVVNPAVLTDTSREFRDIREQVPDEELEKLYLARARSVAFSGNRYGQYYHKLNLSAEVTNKLAEINPYHHIEQADELEQDYYDAMLEIASGKAFYELHRKELEVIAKVQQQRKGKQLKPSEAYPPEQFMDMMNRVAILDVMPLAKDNAPAIFALSSAQRKEAVEMLEFVAHNQLDEGLEYDLAQGDWSELRDKLMGRISEHMQNIFELKSENEVRFEGLTGEAIAALSIYYRQTCRKRADMEDAFRQFIEHVVAGDYEDWRAWGEGGSPENEQQAEGRLNRLRQEGLLPTELSAEQYRAWLEHDEAGFDEALGYDIKDVHSSVRDILSQAMADHHIDVNEIPPDDEVLKAKYERLTEPIKEWTARQKELKARFKAVKKARKKGLKYEDVPEEEKAEFHELQQKVNEHLAGNNPEIKRTRAQIYLARLRRISLEGVETKSLAFDDKKKRLPLDVVFRDMHDVFDDENPDFAQDLERIEHLLHNAHQSMFGGERISKSKLILTDEVDVSVHALIGEKPVPSCQSYKSSMGMNVGLMSYLSDPGVKIIQMYDEDKNILARAVVRMLENDAGEPALFMERVYSSNSHPKIKEAMGNFVQKKAQKMGVNAHSKDETVSDKLSDVVTLRGGGSRSPFVYTDAGGGKVPNGLFEVRV